MSVIGTVIQLSIIQLYRCVMQLLIIQLRSRLDFYIMEMREIFVSY